MKNTLDRKMIPAKNIYYFRQRFKNRIFQSALAYFVGLAKEKNLTKKDIANSLDKDPAQITRWFAGPNNWTLDTISDLLLAMDAELKYEIVSLYESSQQKTNTQAIRENSTQLGTATTEANNILAFEKILKVNRSTKNSVAMTSGLNIQGSHQVSDAQLAAEQAIHNETQTSNRVAI